MSRLGREGALREAIAAAEAAGLRAELDADLAWIESTRTRLVECGSAGFPPQLAATAGAPAVLAVRGDPAVLATRQVAIVGSREPTPGGRAIATEFAFALSRAAFAITSGLAHGIDAAAHAGALAAGGITIAVLGTGLDRIYPQDHAQLAESIVAAGGVLVSELAPRSPPKRAAFPQRNRIISALAIAVLVVEAGETSGSLGTAQRARAQGRALFAVPGSIRNPLARGCHQLIRAGARLVQDPRQLLEDLDISHKNQNLELFEAEPLPRPELDKEREILLDACGFDPISFDVLVERTGWAPNTVASLLLLLELDGLIQLHPGGRYGRIQQGSG